MMASGGPAERQKAVVFVPARVEVFDGRKQPAAEVRQRPDGTRELPVFSSLGRLVQTLGRHQPWVALPLETVREMLGGGEVDRLALDPAGAPGTWRWTGEDFETSRGKHAAGTERDT